MSERQDRANQIIVRLLAEAEDAYRGDWKRDFLRLWRDYLHPHRVRFALAALITVLWSAMPYAFALSWRYLIDQVLKLGQGVEAGLTREGVRGVLTFLVVNSAIWTGHLFCQQTRGWLIHTIGRNVVYALRRDLHNKLAALHIGFFERTPVGRIMSRVMDDVSVIHGTASSLLVMLMGPIVKLLMGPGLMFYLNWRLALPVILAMPLYGVAFARLRPRIRKTHVALRRLNSRMYAGTAERISGIRVVQAFGREDGERRSLARLINEFVRVAMRLVNYEQGLALVSGLITAGVSAGAIYFAALSVKQGAMTLGDLVAFVSAMAPTFGPIGELFGYLVQAQSTLVVLRRVFNLLDEKIEVKSGNISLDGMAGKVEFDRVTFRYPGQRRPALDNVRFFVRPGEKVALMGPSGSGKTTVFQLLLRFYDPQEGSVRVGGVDLQDADLASLRRHVCMVQQEPVVFSGTIAENITYGRADARAAEMILAAEAAELDEFIMAQPLKFEATIGEAGVTLSGGQRQRLALAAALLTQPEILLLDDTTSALDAATEARIRSTLKHVLEKRTSLIITQRAATARDCDRIIVFERGRIVQAGAHEELMNQDGFYRAVCRQQERL